MSLREYNIMKSDFFFIIIQKNPAIFFTLQKHNQVNLEGFLTNNLIIVKINLHICKHHIRYINVKLEHMYFLVHIHVNSR